MWWGFSKVPKKTKSPGLRLSLSTCTPSLIWSKVVLPTDIPKCAYTYCVNPEQSKPEGDVPPHRYGVPRKLEAYAIIAFSDTLAAPLESVYI